MIARLFALLVFVSSPALAQTTASQTLSSAPADDAASLRVGLVERAPYAMRDETLGWTGIAVDLWRLIAEAEGIDHEFVAVDEASAALASGAVDLALPMPVDVETATRHALTQPFDAASMAVASRAEFRLADTLKPFLSWQFARVVLGLSILLLLVGALMWAIERNANPKQFGTPDDEDGERPGLGRRTLRGLGSGFWWSGVTMTTIGYGDKAPITSTGRAVAMVWMLLSMGITASLTAAIVNASGSSAGLSLADQVEEGNLGVVEEIAAAYLDGVDAPFERFETVEAGIAALKDGSIDGLAAPETVLRHAVGSDGSISIAVSREAPAFFAIGGSDAEAVERFERAMLTITLHPSWIDLVKRYAPD